MMMFKDLYKAYGQLTDRADRAFAGVAGRFGTAIKCGEGCSDCCHSVFGLFLIESLYLRHHFDRLDRRRRRESISRAGQADKDLARMDKRLRAYDHHPGLKALAMSGERVRCPLLGRDNRCVLYEHRPVTCRVYGIPTISGGSLHVCWKSGFGKEISYPAFDLDGAYRELYRLSLELLERVGSGDRERASLLVPVSRSIKDSFEDLIKVPGAVEIQRE